MTIEQTRPCTISESIIQSCKEMKSMREGRMPKRSLSELFENIERWSKEENNLIWGRGRKFLHDAELEIEAKSLQMTAG